MLAVWLLARHIQINLLKLNEFFVNIRSILTNGTLMFIRAQFRFAISAIRLTNTF